MLTLDARVIRSLKGQYLFLLAKIMSVILWIFRYVQVYGYSVQILLYPAIYSENSCFALAFLLRLW